MNKQKRDELFKRLTALDADKRCSILSMLFGLLEAEKRVKELEVIEKLASRFELEGGE